MLLPPALALVAQTTAYALVDPLCRQQAGGWLHGVFAAALALALVLTWVAWHECARLKAAHRPGQQAPPDTDRRGLQHLFLAQVGAGVAALSSLALVAMWIPQTMLSPCAA
jgi:hypothetical protein